MRAPKDADLLRNIWSALDGAPDSLERVSLTGPGNLLPSVYDVSALATATVAATTAAVADVHAARTGARRPAVSVDRAHAAVAFRSERYLVPVDWTPPAIWDPIAGDYEARDAWIRLHTNYRNHRESALRVLGTGDSREEVARAVARWGADDLESAVVAAGGCAARMRTEAEWASHPQGAAVEREPLIALATHPAAPPPLPADPRRPLEGLRVLDLTRVIAGPVCTRVLAAYGAHVLRIDPPGFEEVGALLCETTAGKRRAFLDLRTPGDRTTFEGLLAEAHVVVHGYRPEALEQLGLGATRRREIRPGLVDASLDAYGWTGPWAGRRGFDSLVQMSAGIAARGAAAGKDVTRSTAPAPLPAQALDHGTGYLLAAAVCRALVRAIVERRASDVRLSLARTARLLADLCTDGDPAAREPDAAEVDRTREPATSDFGSVRRVRCPGTVDGFEPRWDIDAGALGVHPAAWW
jgi:crotonobetainyl-CoA:carnitine CoA-transferase CaiB-like acyl-CoA transferase